MLITSNYNNMRMEKKAVTHTAKHKVSQYLFLFDIHNYLKNLLMCNKFMK